MDYILANNQQKIQTPISIAFAPEKASANVVMWGTNED